MRPQSQIFQKASSATQPRTWAKQKDHISSIDRAIDRFGWQSQTESQATGAESPTGGFSILDSPMPVQANPQQPADSETDLGIQAKCDRCEAEDKEIQAKTEPGSQLENSRFDLGRS
ncbi:hypothetical protein [Baaleninema simplex]|uniref:hypothetical protein n=1 Tax=Baaleninema simplex TaxID=2862350 RepID=UPI00034B678F|nr:hypothetical protein [Baaleninema simplex]